MTNSIFGKVKALRGNICNLYEYNYLGWLFPVDICTVFHLDVLNLLVPVNFNKEKVAFIVL
jgi:hypothetical protein